MIEDYIVVAHSPIDAQSGGDFILGWHFGHHEINGGQPPETTYWDGQDIWLAPNHDTLIAVFKGTLHFVPSWQPMRAAAIGPVETTEAGVEDRGLPAVGDALVLKLWPQDAIRIGDLLGPGSPVIRAVIYQNVDRESARDSARGLIRSTSGYSQDEMSDADVDEILRQWLNGQGAGIYVDAGARLGRAALVSTIPPQPDGAAPDPDHGVPDGVDSASWARLTLRVFADYPAYINPSFLFHLMEHATDRLWTRPRREESPFVSSCCDHIESLPVARVTWQYTADWTDGDPPLEDMPPAPPTVRLELKGVDDDRGVAGLNDPALDHLWRLQGPIREGDYTFRRWGPQFLAHCDGSTSPGQSHISPQPPPAPVVHIGVASDHWLRFNIDNEGHLSLSPNGRPYFILGVNMEAVRRRNQHDLTGNDVFGYRRGYLDEPNDGSHYPELDQDLANIAATGATVVRVWVFELMEGLRFHFTKPTALGSSLLDQEKTAALANSSLFIKATTLNRVNPNVDPLRDTIFACNKNEWDDFAASMLPSVTDWIEPPGIDPVDGPPAPNGNDLFYRLLANAEYLQRAAGSYGLRVLWTFWVHHGEAQTYYDSLGNVVDNWADFVTKASAPNDPLARLPLDAWIYRSVIENMGVRQSYIENAVVPFVRAMERAAARGEGDTLGYEVMNEPDIVWKDCGHRWTKHVDGSVAQPTRWRLSQQVLREFVQQCADAIRNEAPDKPVLSGVQGMIPDCTNHEMSLLAPHVQSDPQGFNLHLNASALTRYAPVEQWVVDYVPPGQPLGTGCQGTLQGARTWLQKWGTHRVTDFTYLHDNVCLFIEAGDWPWPNANRFYDCGYHKGSIYTALNMSHFRGYGGIIVWHYNDPARSENKERDVNALTEAQNAQPPPHHHPNDAVHTTMTVHFGGQGVQARPVCDAIRQFANILTPFGVLLPPFPHP